jgi:hypothetical protein
MEQRLTVVTIELIVIVFGAWLLCHTKQWITLNRQGLLFQSREQALQNSGD